MRRAVLMLLCCVASEVCTSNWPSPLCLFLPCCFLPPRSSSSSSSSPPRTEPPRDAYPGICSDLCLLGTAHHHYPDSRLLVGVSKAKSCCSRRDFAGDEG